MNYLVLFALFACAPSAGATSNPLGKVMELMDSLTAKITAEVRDTIAATDLGSSRYKVSDTRLGARPLLCLFEPMFVKQ